MGHYGRDVGGEQNSQYITASSHWETDIGDKIITPFGPTIYQSYVNGELKNSLLGEGREMRNEDHDFRENLAGNMYYGGSYTYDKEYIKKVEPDLRQFVHNWFDALITKYGPGFHEFLMKGLFPMYDEEQQKMYPGVPGQNCELYLDSLWINFSRKHDFNPDHHHTGIISFVIYLLAPPDIFEINAVTNSANAGLITFSCGSSTKSPLIAGEYKVQPAEGLLLMFPAELTHSVAPFWIDAERISVSGNFDIRPIKKND